SYYLTRLLHEGSLDAHLAENTPITLPPLQLHVHALAEEPKDQMWSPTIMQMIMRLHCGTTSNHTVLWYPAPTPQHQCRLAQESPPRGSLLCDTSMAEPRSRSLNPGQGLDTNQRTILHAE
ncbi:hypothetical protein D6C98_06888, partial [Aureobasidium pullulans]